jgi:hypothetical protein
MRIKRAGKALDAPVDCLMCHLYFALELPETRVKPEKCVDRRQPPPKRDLRTSEDRAGLVIERAVAILTEIPLKLSIATVSDRSV